MDPNLTARHFIEELTALKTKNASDNARYFKGDDKGNKILGIRMSVIFSLAKKFVQMPLAEVEKLLNNNFYEVRMGAVSIMDYQARDKKTTQIRRKELYELYINRHDRINNWDLVDRTAPYVIGGYLFEKSRAPLLKLAKSKNIWERRTSIVATYFFIRQGDIEDTFKIAGILVHDKEELINMAVGSWIREAGKRDKQKLIGFLNNYADSMPRIALRYAIEKLDKKEKEFYMSKGGSK